MVEPRRLQLNAFFQSDASALDVIKIAARFHLANVHGEIGCRHLISKYLFEAPSSARAFEQKAAFRIHIQRPKERHALNVIPVKVGDEDVGRKRTVAKFALQLLAKHAETGAAIEDVNAITQPYFHAGGIASVTHILGLWSWRGTAYAPELDAHKFVTARGPDCFGDFLYLLTIESVRQLPDWFAAQVFRPEMRGPEYKNPSPIMNREALRSGGPHPLHD